MRIINEGNWVINNLFYECRGVNFRSPLAIMNGVFNSPAFRYLPVRDAVVANNTFINCTSFSLCEGSDTERTVPPRNVYFFNNVFLNKKDATLYEVFDKIDSIYFFNNIADNSLKQHLMAGYKKQLLTIEQLKSTPININTKNNEQLDSIKKIAITRLVYGLPKTVGFTRWAAYKNATKNLYTGKGYKSVSPKKIPTSSSLGTIFNCKNAAAIYKAMQTNAPNIHIVLTGGTYYFDKPIETSQKFILSSTRMQPIAFASDAQIPAIFIIKAGSFVSIQHIILNGTAVKANNFLLTDTTGSSNHYQLSISDCAFTNFNSNNGCSNLFNASKYVVADSINYINCSFNNNKCNLFYMNNERDNKGYYSVENMRITNCQFTKNDGIILNLYRGGNDESTMGPKLTFNNNIITNCNSVNALVMLFGVQESYFTNNHFTNCNAGNTTISYVDKVRGLHIQKNNQFTNCGVISENKFVINIK